MTRSNKDTDHRSDDSWKIGWDAMWSRPSRFSIQQEFVCILSLSFVSNLRAVHVTISRARSHGRTPTLGDDMSMMMMIICWCVAHTSHIGHSHDRYPLGAHSTSSLAIRYTSRGAARRLPFVLAASFQSWLAVVNSIREGQYRSFSNMYYSFVTLSSVYDLSNRRHQLAHRSYIVYYKYFVNNIQQQVYSYEEWFFVWFYCRAWC